MQLPVNQYEVTTASGHSITVSCFELVPYLESFKAMSEFAINRDEDSSDQIWLLQHPSVYTQGTACTQETLSMSNIPVVKSDRGGQITYHGPGQIVMYPLLRLKRYEMGIKSLVNKLEQSVIDVLKAYKINSERRIDAPGIYINQAKIGALGLRIKRGTSYHGLSFNVDMDLTPFTNIDPCGYEGLKVTQFTEFSSVSDFTRLQQQLVASFVALL